MKMILLLVWNALDLVVELKPFLLSKGNGFERSNWFHDLV